MPKPWYYMDVYCFETGYSFEESILEKLDNSKVLVLFASANSLKSFWVKFELEQAKKLSRNGILKRSITLVIDENISHKDLPDWMQETKIERVYFPSRAAEIIQAHRIDLLGLNKKQYFVGREDLLSDFNEKFIPESMEPSPKIIVLHGLSGVGRRTFLRNALKSSHSLTLAKEIDLEPTDDLDKFYFMLLDRLGGLHSKDDFDRELKYFRKLNRNQRSSEISKCLESLTLENSVPVIVDNGAFLDSSNKYNQDLINIFEAYKKTNKYLAIIHTRKPSHTDIEWKNWGALYFRVPPLGPKGTRKLLSVLFQQYKINASEEDVNELILYLEGYPPSVNHAALIAKEHNLSILLADKKRLEEFKAQTFKDFDKGLDLSEHERLVLKILANQTSLSLSIICKMLDLDEKAMAALLTRLIDFNFILNETEFDTFRLSPPLRNAVLNKFSDLTIEEFAKIAESLKKEYWEGDLPFPSLEVVNATVHALLKSNSSELSNFKGIILPSVIYKVAKDIYDQKSTPGTWGQVRDLTLRVLSLDKNHIKARILYFKCLVRLSNWGKAKEQLEKLKILESQDGYYYLEGFYHWKRSKFAKAITSFKTALLKGNQALAVYHGLGYCFFMLGKYKEALKEVNTGLQKYSRRGMFLDLGVKITMRIGDLAQAEKFVEEMKSYSEDHQYRHRKSTLHNRKYEFQAALRYSQQTILAQPPRFEYFANHIDNLIELENFDEAGDLINKVDRDYQRAQDKRDYIIGLRCKLFIKRHNIREAEDEWNKLADKNIGVSLNLMAQILEQKIEDSRSSPSERLKAKEELIEIKNKMPENPVIFYESVWDTSRDVE